MCCRRFNRYFPQGLVRIDVFYDGTNGKGACKSRSNGDERRGYRIIPAVPHFDTIVNFSIISPPPSGLGGTRHRVRLLRP